MIWWLCLCTYTIACEFKSVYSYGFRNGLTCNFCRFARTVVTSAVWRARAISFAGHVRRRALRRGR